MHPPSALPAVTPFQPVLRDEVRALWTLAWPILVGQLANIGMSVAAVAMSGHVSAQDLAGVSLGVSLWNIVIITLIGLLMSVNPTVAHHVGAQNLAQVPHVVRQALWKSLLLGLIATAVLQSTQLIFAWMTLEAHTRTVAQHFVQIASFGLPAYAAYRVLYGYSASINQTKPMMVVALLAL
jgi:multidrug resistance protein, MATE family